MTNKTLEIKISDSFTRSVNIENNTEDTDNLQGYVCTASAEAVLLNMILHLSKSKQSSFTWTGPYGSGKSSLVLLFANLLRGNNKKNQTIIKEKLSNKTLLNFESHFGKRPNWHFLPVVGSVEDPLTSIVRSLNLEDSGISNSKELFQTLDQLYSKKQGLLIVIDEMGKYLEAASKNKGDAYFFQELAEYANNSNGKVIFVGILHQSFIAYSSKLAIFKKDEWSKIQGRFVDLVVNIAGEEQVELIGKAIDCNTKPKKATLQATNTVKEISRNKLIDNDKLVSSLDNCWPIHPIVAVLLGVVARKRYGQNQRSIFSFLLSAEICGFKDFVSKQNVPLQYYMTETFWNYMHFNFESQMIASEDAKLWVMACEVIRRCEAKLQSNADHIVVLKTICLLNLFKGNSGLIASSSLLDTLSIKNTDLILKDLSTWKLIIFKEFLGGYSIFEGSDFDLNSEIKLAIQDISIDYNLLRNLASFQPAIAKKHYHQTGAMRWMEIIILPVSNATAVLKTLRDTSDAFGAFCLFIPQTTEEYNKLDQLIPELLQSQDFSNLRLSIAVAPNYLQLSEYAQELLALDWMKSNHKDLSGDSIARAEVQSRFAYVLSWLNKSLQDALYQSEWFDSSNKTKLTFKDFSILASKYATETYHQSPIVKSELINKSKPSGSANGGLKKLLYHMVLDEGKPLLNITGNPAEWGLFNLLLKSNNLYNSKMELVEPQNKDDNKLSLLWQTADRLLLDNNKVVDLVDLHKLWTNSPYGMKEGLFPFFSLQYLLTRRAEVSVYLEGVYCPDIDDLFVDYLLRNIKLISMRWVTLDHKTESLLMSVKDHLLSLNTDQKLTQSATPLEIAKTLVRLILKLDPWVLRTRNLSKQTTKFREIVKSASDPNKLLFDDLPNIFNLSSDEQIKPATQSFVSCINELTQSYNHLIDDLGLHIFQSLGFELNESSIKEINTLASLVKDKTGDFRIDALAGRLMKFEKNQRDIGAVASLAANKPIRDWIDLDVARAKIEIAELCQKLKRSIRLIGAKSDLLKKNSISMLIGNNTNQKIYDVEYDITEKNILEAQELQETISTHFKNSGMSHETLLYAISNLSKELLSNIDQPKLSENES